MATRESWTPLDAGARTSSASRPARLSLARSNAEAVGSQPSLHNVAPLTPSSVGPSTSQTSINTGRFQGDGGFSSQPPLYTKPPKPRVEALLIGDDDPDSPPRRPATLRGWPKFLLRSSKLLAFKALVEPRLETSLTEKKKIAFQKNKTHALVYGLIIHFLPAGAALALIVLNSTQYYVGSELAGHSGQDDQKLGALTFAAKLHELLMLASLAAALFAYFRRELLYGEGLPYGAVSGGLQFKEFSFLYSPELLAAFRAEWHQQRKKWTLIVLLLFCTLLGVSVGPSTNNLMRPRLDWWDAGGTTFWIDATTDILQPNTTELSSSVAHCNIDTGDAACPYGDWEIMNRQYHSYWPRLEPMGDMPELLGITSPLSERQMVLRHRSTENNLTSTIWQNAYSMASVQQSVVADGLAEVGRLWAFAAANAGERQKFVFRNDAQFTTNAVQPITQVRCEESIFRNDDVGSMKLSFPIFAAHTCNGDSSSCYLDPTNFFSPGNASLLTDIKAHLTAGSSPALTWVELDTVPALSNSSIQVIATFPMTTAGDQRLYCCSIDSVNAPAAILASRASPKVVSGYPDGMLGDGTGVAGAQRIYISAAWAELLYPNIPSLDTTVFSQMVATAGMWNTSLPSQTYNFPFIMESILATSVTNGLARSTYNKTIIGSLKDSNEATCDGTYWCGGLWEREMIPKSSLGWGGSAFEISAQDQERATMFTMHATVNGYAWSSRGKLQKAAIAVLSLYTGFAVCHFMYLIATGRTSQAWDKAPEMISLAMNSQPTAALRNTGAGIDTIHPYKAKVKIKVGPHGHLEYIFEDTLGYGSVRSNVLYA